jgi:GTPase SAR1 family protein
MKMICPDISIVVCGNKADIKEHAVKSVKVLEGEAYYDTYKAPKKANRP